MNIVGTSEIPQILFIHCQQNFILSHNIAVSVNVNS